MPTTTEGLVLKEVIPGQACVQLASTECKTCQATLIRLDSTAYQHVWHWLVNTPCGHSRLCGGTITCPKCLEEFTQCRHCEPTKCPACGEWITPTILVHPTSQRLL